MDVQKTLKKNKQTFDQMQAFTNESYFSINYSWGFEVAAIK